MFLIAVVGALARASPSQDCTTVQSIHTAHVRDLTYLNEQLAQGSEVVHLASYVSLHDPATVVVVLKTTRCVYGARQ